MLIFTLLLFVLFVLLALTILFVGLGGIGFVLVFGDCVVFCLIIYAIVKLLGK